MTATECLRAARAIGIDIAIDGDGLVLEASSPPPVAILDALSCNKAGIIALLRPGADGWSAEDWQMFFDERAGIVEFDGGLHRSEAEARAFACCIAEWLNRNPVRSSTGHCLGCGDEEQTHDPLVPFGTETTGHAWLHHRCWASWYESRKADAAAALKTMGIEKRSPHP